MSRALLVVLTALHAIPASGATRADVEVLADALGLADVIAVMREEGLEYGAQLQDEMFPGRRGGGWEASIDQIYDAERMERTVIETMVNDLAEIDVAPLIAFFTSDRGHDIISFEVSAREAMVDPDVEDAAEAHLLQLRADEAPELERIDRFVEANDLIESNVVGAMNANYAFYSGMIEGGGFGGAMTEREALADIWAQEAAIRAETDLWVYAYLTLAYQPVSDEDFDAYIALSETEAGEELNRALFSGFDAMYVEISHALGLGTAGFMRGEDI